MTVAVVTGALAGAHTSTWGMYKDAIHEGFALGKYARQTARTSSTPDWLAALNARSDALNKQYGLGDYAPKR